LEREDWIPLQNLFSQSLEKVLANLGDCFAQSRKSFSRYPSNCGGPGHIDSVFFLTFLEFTSEYLGASATNFLVICAPQKKQKKKTTINTLDVSAEEMDYQKKLNWLKDHGELTGEEGNNSGEDSSGNDSA
jgi:hypothetical protein